MSKFQVFLLFVFGFFIVVAVLVFSLYRGGTSSQEVKVTVWGSLSMQDFTSLLDSVGFAQREPLQIEYVEKPANAIESDFTEALARGLGPDLIILRQDQYWESREKLLAIPYRSISERDFKETFVEAGEIYLAEDGVYAFPLAIDPLVLYYNRDSLSAAGVAKPISFWDEIYASTANLSRRDAAGNLTKSAIALGEMRNIANGKDILSLLFLQAGTPITGFFGSELRSYLSDSFNFPIAPADSALEFYTQFSNPTKSFYSWNRVLPEAQTRFASGDLAYYIGFASELRALRNKNPTLNFSVASVPQSRVSGKTVTFGRLYGLSISRGTKYPQAALDTAVRLISRESLSALSQIMVLPPARRDLLTDEPTDSILPVFYAAALQTKSWIDPDASGTQKIFTDMVEAVTSGRARTAEALTKANQELGNLITN